MKTETSNFNHGDLYDFCVDWSMNMTSKKTLCKRFVVLHRWNFMEFQAEAIKFNWFTNSMYALMNAEEFSA